MNTSALHPLVQNILTQLPPELQEYFQERAAIMEFEVGLQRDHAEALALLDILRQHPDTLQTIR